MRRATLAALLILCALPAAAQHEGHAGHGGHAAPSAAPSAASRTTEAGQGGFAALAEVVAILRADPATDWSRVDLPALIAHLRDMEALMTELEVAAEDVPGGARFTIRRGAPGAQAAWRMVPAHERMVTAETGWTAAVEDRGDALVWTVTGAEDAAVIRGLGFFGLMATGSHHPRHHLSIARGGDPHAH